MARFHRADQTLVRSQEETSFLCCRRCRTCVIGTSCLFMASDEMMAACTVWHLDSEALPDWIMTLIHQVQWTTGKLNCPHCGARLGGFNFISCSKCSCGRDTIVHLSKSRVDHFVKRHISVIRPGIRRENEDYNTPPEQNLQHDHHSANQTAEPEHQRSAETFIPLCRAGVPPGSENEVEPVQEPSEDSSQPAAEEPSELSDPQEEPEHGTRTLQLVEQENMTGDGATFGSAHALTKRERNRLKSLRRKQRKKERWMQRQLEEEELIVNWMVQKRDDEQKEAYTCAVCLDVFYKPCMCQPCSHLFCEPCLRTLAKNRSSSTPCPLCRTLISHVVFQEELHKKISRDFPKEFNLRRETVQRSNLSKWPLPCRPGRFSFLWGMQRRGSSPPWWRCVLMALRLDSLYVAWTFPSNSITFILLFYWLLSVFILCGLTYIFFFL